MTDEPPEVETWLRGLHRGQPQALASLFDYYRDRLRQMVRLHMDPRVAARVDPSDVLQEAYMDASRQIETYLREPKVAFYVWLRGLAWERLLNLRRTHVGSQRRAVGRELPLPEESSARLVQQLLAASDSTPSEHLLKDELQRRVRTSLEALGPSDREVILMRHFEFMSNLEVAQALGLSASGAAMRYGRAIFRLKEILLKESENKTDGRISS
jgi:RNA polymerase sigma-70 factor (ECF subfamily)